MPAELAEKLFGKTEDEFFEVWPENWKAVQLFIKLTTQWTHGAMGGAIGLNYQSLAFMLKIYPVKNHKRMVRDIQVMELAALRIMNERKEA